MAREFQLELDPSINEVFDEIAGNSFLALRRLRWSPTSSFKLDIRKWYTNSSGEEIAGKGVSFMTEDGPDNLIEALMNHGYGDTRKTLNAMKSREDFLPAVKEIIAENNFDLESVTIPNIDSLESFYDPKSIL